MEKMEDILKKQGSSTDKKDISFIEEASQIMSITSNLTSLQDHAKVQLKENKEAIIFSLTVKQSSEYKWTIIKPLPAIKKSMKDIKKEMKNAQVILKPSIKADIKMVKRWSIEELKSNLQKLNEVYHSFYKDDRVQKSICLNEFFEISRNSFNIYNNGRKPKEGYINKKADPRCWRRVFSFVCKCIECLVCSQYNRRWFVLKDDMICYLNSSTDQVGKNVYWFDDEIKVERVEDMENCINISNVSGNVILNFNNAFECEQWFEEISNRITSFKNTVKNNKFSSYTNQKRFNLAKWFVDGEDYFKDLQEKLLNAKESVFITDWWLSPELYLVRPVNLDGYMAMAYKGLKAKEDGTTRLMDILNYLAGRGVQVYVLIYCEMSLALTLNSKHSKTSLVQLHENIKVTRHPKDPFDLLWSHHEKLVVIDQTIGYVGGLDLCWGRFDTNAHPLIEEKSNENTYLFPGIDYSNSRIRDFNKVNEYLKEAADRTSEHRMPWHDVHTRLTGPVVADIARHFVERWNFARFEDRKMAITDVKQNASVNRAAKGDSLHKIKKETKIPFIGKFMQKALPDETASIELEDKKKLLIEKEENKEGEIEIAPVKGKEGQIEIISTEKKSNPIQPGLLLAKTFKNVEIDNLMELFMKGKTKIDDDHLLVKKPEVSGEKPKSAYGKFVQGVKTVKMKKDKDKGWFNFANREETHLKTKFNFGVLSRGDRSKVQVLRSGCNWSTGISKTEQSILQGYYHLIDHAKHYIYIENQFFVSKAFSEEERRESRVKLSNIVENEIAYHLRRRIEEAYKNREKFHVFVFIPLLPGFAGEPESSSTLQIILKHTMESISNNCGFSLIEKLYELMGEHVYKYLSFCSLRTHAVINKIPVTELVYIHSKLMIVDDTEVLIGSANINDRSMLGTRDSEYAVIIKESKVLDSQMNGKAFKAANYAASFRKALMAEHLGLSLNDSILIDPLNDKLLDLISSRAMSNTALYRELFGCYPDDTYTSFAKLNKFKPPKGEKEIEAFISKYEEKKKLIIGHIVEFPTQFLRDEKLGISFFSVENLVPERNFT